MEVEHRFLLVDSSVFLSSLIESDSNYNSANLFLESVASNCEIILPPLCIFEISVTLSKFGYDEKDIISTVNNLIGAKNIIVSQLNDLQFFKDISLLKNKENIGTHDFYLLQTAMQFKIPIYTFDKKFAKHADPLYDKIILLS